MEDILALICIVPFPLMDITISVEETLSIVRLTLKLECYISGLKTHFLSKHPKSSYIPIQDFFSVLDSKEFWAETTPVMFTQLANGYNTLTNINLIKAAVFLVSSKKTNQKHVDEFLRLFQMADPKKKGKISLNTDFLFLSLAAANRFFPRKLINLWIEKNLWTFGNGSEIQMHEFLFFACNSYDRNTMMSYYLAKVDLKESEKQNGLFKIKSDLDVSDPDERLDRMLGVYHMANIKCDFENPNRSTKTLSPQKSQKKTTIKKVDKIIERVLSKKSLIPNPYKKLPIQPKINSTTRPTTLSINPTPLQRPQTSLKSFKSSIDLSKLNSSSSITASKAIVHVPTFREAVLSSFKLPQKLIRSSSYLTKSKLDQSNIN